MDYYISFKVEVFKIKKTALGQNYIARSIIKLLEKIGYENSDALTGVLFNDANYVVRAPNNIYKYISNKYPNNKSVILAGALDYLRPFNAIRCISNNRIYSKNSNSDSYSKVLVLNAINVLNIYKLLL